MRGRPRILYLHYAPSAGFPPLLNSAEIFVRLGWSVMFLNVSAEGTTGLGMPHGPGITATQLRHGAAGWRQKGLMGRFCARALAMTVRWRPDWIYVSDVLACPAGLAASYLTRRVVYHEHDVPEIPRANMAWRASFAARRTLSRRARLCIAPNSRRGETLRDQTGATDVEVVWNCPLRKDALPRREESGGTALRLYYHGSINVELLPESVFAALSRVPDATLHIVGYETMGSRGYSDRVRQLARQYGIDGRIELVPAMPRERLFIEARKHDVGLALMPTRSGNVNHRTMVGASNKAFDYLAAGLPLLVSDLPDWTQVYVAPGYGMACDPESPDSIAAGLRSFASARARTHAMGEAGRQRVLLDWNYEHQFEHVLETIKSP